tara:strand:+ start:1278 stop:2792 length:1515 start_codon:yes stop_codon:yes gene_type:complete
MSENHLYNTLFKANETNKKNFLINNFQEVTFKDFHEIVNCIANLFLKKGLLPGDRVAVQAEKNNLQLAIYVATVKAGGVYLPLNTGYTTSELQYFIEDAEPKIFVIDEIKKENINSISSKKDTVIYTLNKDESGTLKENLLNQSKQFTPIDRDKDDLAAILYTSGTTGKSKGAMLTHKNLSSNAQVLKDAWKFSEDDVLLHMLPIYHTHGLFVACNLLSLVGGSMIFLEKFDASEAIKWMPKVTTMMGVPTFYTRLLANEELNHELTKNVRLFISGSAPLLAETHIEFEKRTAKKILERYGMTETNMNISNPYQGERKPGTVGKPLPGIDIRIVDEKGRHITGKDIGVIELKGDNVFSGYWKLEDKTKESFSNDGYFITGDLATRDDDGYFTIVGRDKDMIISGGLNVYPKEIETIINEISQVNESAVFGINHKDFGEAVVAAVVFNDTSNILSEEDILEKLYDKLAKFKQPKKIFFLDHLPRNSMGKVQKNKLRQVYKDYFIN